MSAQKNPVRRLKLQFLLVSFFLALAITLSLRTFLTPNALELIQHENRYDYIIYHDFDKDGISEIVTGGNDHRTNGYKLHVRNLSGKFLDQCNYIEPTRFESQAFWLDFGDYNDDGLDEVFAFTQKDDSLFLYMHDLRRKRVVIKRQFLIKALPPIKYPNRYFGVQAGGLIDLDGSGNKGLVFSAGSGISWQPRGVYIYNIQEKKITSRLENYVAWYDLFFYDLTGDGHQEIILTGLATGTIDSPQQYSDDRCWLFVLDQKLNPIFQPLSFGKYSSGIDTIPIEINNERYLLIAYHNQSEKSSDDFICLVNSQGKLLPELQGKFGIAHFDHLKVDKGYLEPNIFTANSSNELIKMNKNFEITARQITNEKMLWKTELIDLDRDGQDELICLFDNNVSVYDQGLNLRIKMPLQSPTNRGTYFTFRDTGSNNSIDLGINIENNFYLFAYKKNWLYSMLPFLSVGLVPFIFAIMLGARHLSWLVYTHIRFLRPSLQNTQNGIALLDSAGIIYFFNDKLVKRLPSNTNEIKHRYFAEIWQEQPEVLRAVQTCMQSGKAVQERTVLGHKNERAEYEISVVPFVSRLNLIRSYCVEIRESTQFLYDERIRAWSNAAQNIAHAIKTPLSTVGLSLTTLQMRLDELLAGKSSFEDREQLNDDIKTTRTEINRIKKLANSFVSFSDLGKPNFRIVSAQQLIEQVLTHFKPFLTAKLQIQTNLDSQYNDIWADPQQIEKVLQILIENAVQALNGNGVIEISTTVAQNLNNPSVNFLEFQVADTGPGIAAGDCEKIFEPFFTSKEDGTGMGLPIAKKIVEAHGGKIRHYSKPGFGMVMQFTVQLDA